MVYVLLLVVVDTFIRIQVYLKLMNCNVNLKKVVCLYNGVNILMDSTKLSTWSLININKYT